MKKLFLGSVALVAVSLGTSAAFAAERPVPRPVPAYAPPPPPAYTWSGCYVGASAGTSSGTSQHFTTAGSTIVSPSQAGSPITESFDLSGFIGGGQLGCNWQWGAWVFGIEGDGSAVNKSGQGFELQPIPRGNTLWISETQERWFVTARGRLGLTNFWWFGDKTLLYVTGGGAWAKIDASEWLTLTPQSTGHQESNTRSGWTVGGGIEYALGYGWSVKSEFLYADFGTFTTFTSPPFASTNIQPRDVKLKDYIFRAGMNYKFW
jgi:outer membrane immunogenic protein